MKYFVFLPFLWAFFLSQSLAQTTPKYDEIGILDKNGYSVVSQNGGYDFFDATGKKLNDVPYSTAYVSNEYNSSGYIQVSRDGKFGILDSMGNVLIPLLYEDIDILNGFVFIAQNKGLYGLFNMKNEQILPFEYDRIEALEARLGHYGITDGYSRFGEKEWIEGTPSLANTFLEVSQKQLGGIVNGCGKWIIPLNKYNPDGDKFIAQRTITVLGDSGSALYTLSGKCLVPMGKYIDYKILNFNSFEVAVSQDGDNWALIDSNGNEILPFLYTSIEDVSEGYAIVEQDLVGQLDTAAMRERQEELAYMKQQVVSQEGISSAACETHGNLTPIYKKEQQAIRLRDKKVIFKQDAAEGNIQHFSEGLAVISYQKEVGAIDTTGAWVIPQGKYEDISTCMKGYMIVEKNNKKGIIHRSGKATAIVYSDIVYENNTFVCIQTVKEQKKPEYAANSYEYKPKMIPLIEKRIVYDLDFRVLYEHTYHVKLKNLIENNTVLASPTEIKGENRLSPKGETILIPNQIVYTYSRAYQVRRRTSEGEEEALINLWGKQILPWANYRNIIDMNHYFWIENTDTMPDIFIDEEGRKVAMEEVHAFARLERKEGGFGLQSGDKIRIPFQYDWPYDSKQYVENHSEKAIFFLENRDKYGLITANQEEIAAPIHNLIWHLNDSTLVIQEEIEAFLFSKGKKTSFSPPLNAIYPRYWSLNASTCIPYYLIKQNGRFGVWDSNLVEIITPIYDKIRPSSSDNLYLTLNGKVELMDLSALLLTHQQKIQIPFLYKEIEAHTNNNEFAAIKQHRIIYTCTSENSPKKVIYNEDYICISKEQYDEVISCLSPLIVVKNKGKYGLIDDTGKELLPCVYAKSALSFRYEQPMVSPSFFYINGEKEDEIAFFNTSGKQLSPFSHKRKWDVLGDNFLVYSHDNKVDLIDKNGKKQFSYKGQVFHKEHYRGTFRIPFLHIVEGKTSRFVAANGKSTNADIYDHIEESNYNYYQGVPIIVVEKKGKMGLIDANGKAICPIIYDYIGENESEYSQYLPVMKDSLWSFINKIDGKLLFPFTYPDMSLLKEGLAVVAKDKKVGLIDSTGKIILPLQYEGVKIIAPRIIAISKDCKWQLFRSNGTLLYPQWMDEADWQGGKLIMVSSGGKYGLIDTSGKEILPLVYDKYFDVAYVNDKPETVIIYQEKEGKQGIVCLDGRIIVPFEYDEIKEHYHNTQITDTHPYPVRIGDLWGIITADGKPLTDISYDNIESNTVRRLFDSRENIDKVEFTLRKESEIWKMTEENDKWVLKKSL